jgi:gas vesicle protein
MKNKYAMMYDGNDWTLITKEELIDKLYNEKKDYIEENLDEFIDSLTKGQKNALDRWMELDEDHEKIQEVKEKIKLLLYNKRDIPLQVKNK